MLSVAALFMLPAGAVRGDAVVFYSATPTGPGASVIAGGTSGSILELGCNPAMGACSWDVVMHLDTDGGNLSWGTDLSTVDAAISAAGPMNQPGSPFQVLGFQGAGTPSFGANLLLDSRGAVTVPGGIPAFADFELIKFSLTTASLAPTGSVSEIYAAIDTLKWVKWDGSQEGTPESVVYGTSSPLSGDAVGAVGDEPVITITQVVPEPGTMALLALAGATVLRRKR